MGAESVEKKGSSAREEVQDKLYYVCPICGRPIMRVGCHAVCMHCGYQEGCGD